MAEQTKEIKEETKKEEVIEAGDIKPIIDVVGWRVFRTNNKEDYLDYSLDKQNESILASDIYKLKARAEA